MVANKVAARHIAIFSHALAVLDCRVEKEGAKEGCWTQAVGQGTVETTSPSKGDVPLFLPSYNCSLL